jgi:hypothetical protein
MDERRVERATAHLVVGDDAVLRRKTQHREDLRRFVLQAHHEHRRRVFLAAKCALDHHGSPPLSFKTE